jgi:hypothetical protein
MEFECCVWVKSQHYKLNVTTEMLGVPMVALPETRNNSKKYITYYNITKLNIIYIYITYYNMLQQ